MANYQRSRYIVKFGLQMRYMGVILIALMMVAMVVGWTVYFTIWKQISDPALTNEQLIDIFVRGNEILMWKMLVAIVFICFVSIFVSHKIAGPVYRFEQSARTIANGDFSSRIRLRKGDELHDLAIAFNRMSESLESIVMEHNEVLGQMTKMMEQMRADFDKPSLTQDRKTEILREMALMQSEMLRIRDTFTTEDTEIADEDADLVPADQLVDDSDETDSKA